jgi:hypothetical protein
MTVPPVLAQTPSAASDLSGPGGGSGSADGRLPAAGADSGRGAGGVPGGFVP